MFDISKETNTDPVDIIFHLLMNEPRIMVMRNGKSHEEIKGLLKHSRASVCTDTYAFDLKGSYGNGLDLPEVLPHPHTYCAFPKYITEYPMETIEETLWKVTGFPAGFLGIKGRGVIKESYYADLEVIDLPNLKTKENYIEPRVYPEGIDYVFVNGVIAVAKTNGKVNKAGRVLKKG